MHINGADKTQHYPNALLSKLIAMNVLLQIGGLPNVIMGDGLTPLSESDQHQRLQTPTPCSFVCCWVCERETARCVWRAIWLMTSSRWSSGTFFTKVS